MDINFVEVEDNQIDELYELAKEIWTEHYLPIIGQEQIDYMLEKFQSKSAVLQQKTIGYKYFLIKENAKNCGYIAVQPQEDLLFLSKFYIHKDYRGKGLGRKSYDFVAKLAKRLNLPKIKLTVNKFNDNSVAVYKKLGFVLVDSIVSDIGNGFVMDDFVFEHSV